MDFTTLSFTDLAKHTEAVLARAHVGTVHYLQSVNGYQGVVISQNHYSSLLQELMQSRLECEEADQNAQKALLSDDRLCRDPKHAELAQLQHELREERLRLDRREQAVADQAVVLGKQTDKVHSLTREYRNKIAEVERIRASFPQGGAPDSTNEELVIKLRAAQEEALAYKQKVADLKHEAVKLRETLRSRRAHAKWTQEEKQRHASLHRKRVA